MPTPKVVVEPGRYRHFKGTFYQVLMMGRDSELKEDVVIYKSETDGQVWVRSLESWNTPVANSKPRFQKVPRIGSIHAHKALRLLYEVRGFDDSCAGLNSMIVYRLTTGSADCAMPLDEWLENFTTVEG